MIFEKPTPKKMDLEEENKMLKKAIATLFKKLKKQDK